jgi:monoamine oxidase
MNKLSSYDKVDKTRRRLMLGLAATPFFINSVWASVPKNPDVVIVGAGAAGLGAAKTLSDLGISFVLIEAQSRIGGRAYTDHHTFGVPYDMGCHWFNYGKINPWIDYGQTNDFTMTRVPEDYGLFIGKRRATKKEFSEYELAYDRIDEEIQFIAEKSKNPDISPAQAVKLDNKWKKAAAYMLGPLDMAKEWDDFSCIDYWETPWDDPYYCKEGYGALVAHYGRKIPVQLATPAHHINFQGPGVKVETPEGTIRGKMVILTVSTGVLGAEKIKFTPTLPVKKQESFQHIPMGTYNNATLQFSKDLFGLGPDRYVDYINEAGTESGGMLTNMGGTNLTYVYSGGDLGHELEVAGVKAGVDWGLNEVVKVYGSDVKKHFIKGNITRWGEHPWTLGSYAAAKPGYYHMRDELRKPIADKLFFAGEATHPEQWATCGGGLLSGIDAANSIAHSLGIKRKSPRS